MQKLKEEGERESCSSLLLFADNFAIDFFRRQQFTLKLRFVFVILSLSLFPPFFLSLIFFFLVLFFLSSIAQRCSHKISRYNDAKLMEYNYNNNNNNNNNNSFVTDNTFNKNNNNNNNVVVGKSVKAFGKLKFLTQNVSGQLLTGFFFLFLSLFFFFLIFFFFFFRFFSPS